MSNFALGRRALAICDRCGFTYKLSELKPEVEDLHKTGILVCPSCFDPDQPQLQLGRYPINDPQALRNPRPDTDLEVQRGFSRWDPVGDFEFSIVLKSVNVN